jgi:octaprenyl-diphosphate synthase
VIDFVKNKGGIDYTVQKMKDYQHKAFDILNSYPETPYKASLFQMLNYVIDRKK